MSQTLITEFVAQLQKQGKSHHTCIAYRKDIMQMHESIDCELTKVATTQLNTYLQDLHEKNNFSLKTISRKINSLRTFYKYLEQQGLVKKSPAEEVQHPKFTPKEQRILTQAEYTALREVSKSNPKLHMLIEVLLQAGLRIGELSRLEILDVNLADPEPHFSIKSFSTIPARKVPLTAKLADHLSRYIEEFGNGDPHLPLFHTRLGKPMIIRNIRSAVDRAMQNAGIMDATVNDLRNTFIVLQLKAGLPVGFVAQISGHRRVNTTQKYLQLLPEGYKRSDEWKVAEI